MDIIVKNRKNPLMQTAYIGVISVERHSYNDAGDFWELVLESETANDPNKPEAASFHADKWDIYIKKEW